MKMKETKQTLSVRIDPQLLRKIEKCRDEVEKSSGYKPTVTQVVERILAGTLG